jgi:hypothetical protein
MALILEVYVNGVKFAAAGEESLSVLSAHVTAAGKLGSESAGVRRQIDGERDVDLRIGGLTNRGNRERDEHLNWGRRLGLKPGDEVRILVREGSDYEMPSSRSPVQDVPHSAMAPRKRFMEAKSLYFRMRRRYGTRADKQAAQWHRRIMRTIR